MRERQQREEAEAEDKDKEARVWAERERGHALLCIYIYTIEVVSFFLTAVPRKKREERETVVSQLSSTLKDLLPLFFVCVCSLLSLSEKKNNRSLLSGEFKRGLLHICTRVLLNTHTHISKHIIHV